MLHHIEYSNGMKLGMGYDSITNRLLSSAFSNSEEDQSSEDIDEGNAQTIEFQFKLLKSKEELSISLSTSASISVNFLNWSASGKGQFVETFKSDNQHLYVLSRALITNPYKIRTIDTQYNDDAKKYLSKDKDFRRFFNEYGDYYISGFVSGCELFSLFELHVTDTTVKEELSGSINAEISVNGIGGSGSFNLNKALGHNANKCSLNVYHYQSGGRDVTISTSLENTVEALNALKESVANGRSSLYAAVMTKYDFSQFPDNAANYYLDYHNRFYSDVIKYKVRCQDLKDLIDDVVLYPQNHNGIDGNKLTDVLYRRQEISQFLEDLDKFSEDIKPRQSQFWSSAKNTEEKDLEAKDKFHEIVVGCSKSIFEINKLLPEKLQTARIMGRK